MLTTSATDSAFWRHLKQ